MDDLARQQQELRVDAAAVLEYGERFPHTWTGLKFDGDRLVALFTDPDAHRQDIAALVAHPERVDVRAARRSARHVQAIAAEVRERLESSGGRWSSYGPHLDVVSVKLHGNAEEVARDLRERFGDAVDLVVGAHAYPFVEPPPPDRVPAPQSTVQIAAAGLRTIPDSAAVAAGQLVVGQVEITNLATDGDLAFDTGQPLNGELLDHDHVVGIASGFSVGTGVVIRLGPGDRTSIRFAAGTDSLDLRTGPTLPPGRYQLVVTVPIHSHGREQSRGQRLVTPPVPIDVVADRARTQRGTR